MASTYVNDLRLNEMATGDASGSWGTNTNTNLSLIGEALGFGTEDITTNADTHTSTIADGATDPVRAMYVKYTGTLDSACTITIAPNTINRMQFIENGTNGSQNIIISQGSGANVTIPAGDVKAVYLDGAGSGAAVVDAFSSLSVVDLKVQDDLTVTDDLIVNGDIDLEGAIDVNGTANLDVVDIDGAVQIDATLSVGVNDTGYDVKLFGDEDGAFLLWDASIDDLILSGAKIGIGVATPQNSIHTHIASSGAIYHQFTNTGTGSASGDGWLYGINADENFEFIGQESSESFLIYNNSAYRFSVNHNGIVAVGTSFGTDAVLNVIRSSGEIFRADANNGAFRLVADQDQVFASVMRVTAGAVSAPSYSFVGDTDTGMTRPTTDTIQFINGGSESARFDSSRRFMVGLSAAGDGGYISVLSNGGEGLFNGVDSTNAYRRYFHTVSDGIHRFKGSANTATLSNAGAWGNASDIAYKKDVVDTSFGLETIKLLQPRDYKLKSDDTEHTGFIAQELEQHLPRFVIGNDGEKSIVYGQLTAVLVKAIQELEARITTLEGE